MDLRELIGVALILVGVFFAAVGIFGMMRLPDVYCRMHASGKVATLGIFGLAAGAAVLLPDATLKLAALVLFLLFSAPVASHAIAAAAYRSGHRLPAGERDDLAPRIDHLPHEP